MQFQRHHYRWIMYYLPDSVVEKAYTLQLAKYKQLFNLDTHRQPHNSFQMLFLPSQLSTISHLRSLILLSSPRVRMITSDSQQWIMMILMFQFRSLADN